MQVHWIQLPDQLNDYVPIHLVMPVARCLHDSDTGVNYPVDSWLHCVPHTVLQMTAWSSATLFPFPSLQVPGVGGTYSSTPALQHQPQPLGTTCPTSPGSSHEALISLQGFTAVYYLFLCFTDSGWGIYLCAHSPEAFSVLSPISPHSATPLTHADSERERKFRGSSSTANQGYIYIFFKPAPLHCTNWQVFFLLGTLFSAFCRGSIF